MTTVQNPDFPPVVQFRPVIIIFKRRQGQRGQHIQTGQGMGRVLDFRNIFPDLIPDLIKQIILQGFNLFLGA